MIAAVAGGVMAAATGSDFDKLLKPEKAMPGSEQEARQSMALEIGNRFKTKASTPRELYSRMQELFPPNVDTKSSGESFFELLVKYGAFENTRRNTRCPAVKVTKFILEEFGSMLQTEQYREKYLQHAVKPEALK